MSQINNKGFKEYSIPNQIPTSKYLNITHPEAITISNGLITGNVSIASEFSGIYFKHNQFQEIDFVNEFDGIWASASLLHVPSDETDIVLNNLKNSLKKEEFLMPHSKLKISRAKETGATSMIGLKILLFNYSKIMDSKSLKHELLQIHAKAVKIKKWTNILVRNP